MVRFSMIPKMVFFLVIVTSFSALSMDNKKPSKKRVSAACEPCQLRHQGCESERPCWRCKTNGRQCTPGISKKRGRKPSSTEQLKERKDFWGRRPVTHFSAPTNPSSSENSQGNTGDHPIFMSTHDDDQRSVPLDPATMLGGENDISAVNDYVMPIPNYVLNTHQTEGDNATEKYYARSDEKGNQQKMDIPSQPKTALINRQEPEDPRKNKTNKQQTKFGLDFICSEEDCSSSKEFKPIGS